MKNILQTKNIETKSKSDIPKRNLDNSELIKHFGKGNFNFWKKDIETGIGINNN